ncbi:hypothetical protein VTN31DRAFT_585 [Thermomyces dupontii]|uniref:uncharacterized protein n=1 Tax=Talaromyces thermophilus TaxID=28565 RepID=UPI0037446C56
MSYLESTRYPHYYRSALSRADLPADHPDHLSNILGLHPSEETNCVGFAYTKGRRCKLRTNVFNRRTAWRLLEEGTRLLNSGEECIDDILEELAPLLLCRRWHQYQAEDCVDEWTEKVRKFVQSRRARSGTQSRIARPHDSPQRPQEREQRAPREHEERRDTPRQTQQTFNFETSTTTQIQQNIIIANINVVNLGDNATDTRRRNGPRRNEEQAVSITRSDVPTTAVASSSTQPTTATESSGTLVPSLPSVDTGSSSSTEVPPSSRAVTRRPVEGDCGICLRPLRAAGSETTYTNDSGASSVHIDRSGTEETTSAENEDYQRPAEIDDDNDSHGDNSNIFSIHFDLLENVGENVNAEDEDTPTPRTWTENDDGDGNDGNASPVPPNESEAGDEPTTEDRNATENNSDGNLECAFPVRSNESEEASSRENADTQNPINENGDGDSGHGGDSAFQPESNIGKESSTDENGATHEEEELVWCRECCGQNYHRSCIQAWIDISSQSSRGPTCPLCRVPWSVESARING